MMRMSVPYYHVCSVLGDEVYSPGSGCEDCPEEANQCINDRLCCELYSYACNVDI